MNNHTILIFTNSFDEITDSVGDWLFHFGYFFYRINGANLTEKVKILISDNGKSKILINQIEIENFDVVWYRKGEHKDLNLYLTKTKSLNVKNSIIRFLSREENALKEFLFHNFNPIKTINYASILKFNKLEALGIALDSGLKVPETLVSPQKKDLMRFYEKHKSIITKPISENILINKRGKSYKFFTSEISGTKILDKSETMYPTLVQKLIKKKYEVRVFYFKGIIRSMAIFSDYLDYRENYKSNRYQVYKLPFEQEVKIRRFMKKMKLELGLLDLIKSQDDEYIFLEVNPSGQFTDMSHYCNYYLEELIAKNLI